LIKRLTVKHKLLPGIFEYRRECEDEYWMTI
jgi:hypothetical protein